MNIFARWCLDDEENFIISLQIIDPYVEVEIIGLPVDNRKYRTRTVLDNGMNISMKSDKFKHFYLLFGFKLLAKQS